MGDEEQSLRAALQAEFDRLGHGLTAQLPAHRDGAESGAVVRNGDRDGNVVKYSDEQHYFLNFRKHGVPLANGRTTDLSTAAGALGDWLAGVPTGRLTGTWPCTSGTRWSETAERGEVIDEIWESYRNPPVKARHRMGLRSFATAVVDEPRLLALFPFTSHFTLGFRRTVGFTHGIDHLGIGLYVHPLGDDTYQVRGPGRREYGVADAAGSVRLALAVLDDIEAAEREGRLRPS